jgi:hypothetical protein
MKKAYRKELFKTATHTISDMEFSGIANNGHAMIEIKADNAALLLIMRDDEMDSLARQWLAHSAIHDGYTNAELTAAFDKVKNADHWKNPIDATIPVADVDITAKAIEFFTATKASLFRVGGIDGKVRMRVTAPGYYAGPAN